MSTADELRRVVLALPEAEERETWGHPTFRVRDKMFAALSDDGQLASVKATREEQAALIAAAHDAGQDGSDGWSGPATTSGRNGRLAERRQPRP